MEPIVIVDYGAGNLRSVQKAFENLGHAALVTADPEALAVAPAIIFPGQGACPPAMETLRRTGMDIAVHRAIKDGKPFFGVCLGLQLLFDWSDEGGVPCLGVIPGTVRKLAAGQRVPHMGWNDVRMTRRHPVFDGVPHASLFYFVHSYYGAPADDAWVSGVTDYGGVFCSVAARDNVVATQFHPEKSGATGLRLYDNFVRYFVRRGSARGRTR